MDVVTLTELLREAEEHHGGYEKTAPRHHWSDWYAAYIVARERGRSPEEAARDARLHMEELQRQDAPASSHLTDEARSRSSAARTSAIVETLVVHGLEARHPGSTE